MILTILSVICFILALSFPICLIFFMTIVIDGNDLAAGITFVSGILGSVIGVLLLLFVPAIRQAFTAIPGV